MRTHLFDEEGLQDAHSRLQKAVALAAHVEQLLAETLVVRGGGAVEAQQQGIARVHPLHVDCAGSVATRGSLLVALHK